MVITVITVSKL